MTITAFEAILLGIIQGLTEFLPVSSSGHLVIAQTLLGIDEEVLIFDVFVHVGTLVAVFTAYWKDIWAVLRRPFCKFTGLIIIACIPTGIMGLCLDDIFSLAFSSVVVVACALIVTGIILIISDSFKGTKTINDMNVGNALLVGFCQGCAITPGLSRSGSTIFGALCGGLKRSEAAKFSFIVSIPVILAAAAKEVFDAAGEGLLTIEWTYYLGAVVAAISGYFAIRFFIHLLEKHSLKYFSFYCWIIAAIVLVKTLF